MRSQGRIGHLVAHGTAIRRAVAAGAGVLVAVGAIQAGSAAPAQAADGTILRTVTAENYSCSVGTGIAFDGHNLLLSCDYDNVITVISPSGGSFVRSYTISGITAIGALAWDRGRGELWACGGFGGDDTQVYRINLTTEAATPIFGGTQGCPDGLAYDGSDNSLYVSADVASTVQHYKTDGTLIEEIPVGGKLGSCGNSGLAVGGPYLFLANDGCSQIYRVPKAELSNPGFVPTLFGSYPARLEDVECDDRTFQSAGHAAVWSKDAYDGILNAFELNPGDCGFGGQTSYRYVTLGDSIPYGHGLSLPSRNDPPSPLAYPQVVDSGLRNLRPLSYRPTGCGLTGSSGVHYDQLAISGAPLIDNQWTGGNSNCHVTPKEAVFTDEVGAAGMRADPPALVTIQAGADDVNFSACLGSVLSEPGIFGAEQCVTKDARGYHVTPKVATELRSVRTGLTDIVNFIHRSAPKAQIVVLDYYQIIPSATADLAGTSLICKDLRFSSKGGNWRTNIRAEADFLQRELNGTIMSVVARFTDVAPVDISGLFSGHEMCTTSTWQFDGAHTAAHPTATGQAKIGQAVLQECARLPKRCIGR